MSSLIVFAAACALAAFCSGSETAFSAAGKVKVAASGKRGARALWFMEKPSRYLATTLVGTNIGIVLTSSISSRWGSQMGGAWQAVFIFFTALFLLLFSEITPKQLALFRSNRVSVASAPVLYIFRMIMYPLIVAASSISSLVAGSGSDGSFFESKKEVQGLLLSSGGGRGRLASSVITMAGNPVSDYSRDLTSFPGVDSRVLKADAIDVLLNSKEDLILVWEEHGVTLLGAVEGSALVRWDGEGPISRICVGLPSVENETSPLIVLSDLWRSGSRAAILLDINQQPKKLVTAAMILNRLVPEKTSEGL